MRAGKVLFVVVVASAGLACNNNKKVEPSAVPSASASAAKVDDKSVTFTKKSPAIGQKTEETDETGSSLTMNIDLQGTGKPQKSETSSDEALKYTEEVLAASGDTVTKVKATFDKVDEKTKENGKETKKPSAIAGKSYVVESKNGTMQITDDKGKVASPGEIKEVEKHFKSLGKPDPFLSAITTVPLKPGDKSDSFAKAITEEMKEDADDMKVSDVVVTFKDKSGDDGLFDVAMKMSKEDGTMTTTVDMKGQMRVSTKTGRPTRMDLKGPITIGTKADPKSKAKYDGSGSMTLKVEEKAL